MSSTAAAPGIIFGRHRKIMPYLPAGLPAGQAALYRERHEKAASLNSHLLGFGAVAEAEWAAGGLPQPDIAAMRRYRLERIRAELRRRDLAGVLLYDPVNIRYATDTTNMQVWVAHNPSRYCFVANDGPVVLFDYFNCEHMAEQSEVVDQVRPAVSFLYFYVGDNQPIRIARWADGIAELMREHGGGNRRLAVDHLDVEPAAALRERGMEIVDAWGVMELARVIKSADEITCMRRAIVSCEAAMAEMEAALRPGITENELWAELHRGNIARGGEWIETRLLTSGPRTNPWFQECSARVIEAGDLVAFDTDLIGPHGFCADISRTWLCGDGPATSEQRDLFRAAIEQVEHNSELLRPGISFRELVERSKNPPQDALACRYSVLYHGVGLADEYPTLPYLADWAADTADGVLEAGMVLCVESYVGRLGGREGVKYEEQVLVTENGPEQLSTYPLDARLAA